MFISGTPNIVLIGLRGSGKSTIGRSLAVRLGREFVDLDALTPIEMREPDVTTAFAHQGEAAFRRAERHCLARALNARGQVIALGGGTPTAPGVAELIAQARTRGEVATVYLRASAPTLRDRLKAADNSHRPSLTGRDLLEEVDELLAKRDPLYLRLADQIVELESLPAGAASAAVVDHLATIFAWR
jgi:shikimate kinase